MGGRFRSRDMAEKANIVRRLSNVNIGGSSPLAQSDLTCIVCFRDSKFFSVGACDHVICLECSARMRVLAPSQNECAICRQDLEHVVFTKTRTLYRDLKSKLRMFIYIPIYNIYMEDGEVEVVFHSLLEARCQFCVEPQVFKEFKGLKTHVQRTHDLHACDLCIEYIKLFPAERRFYTRPDLALHKRKGDKEDSSHKGHPICRFCDRRYFDDDGLFKHLRKDHYFCHFCDSDGFNHFYNNYDELRIHFRCDHYLCEEENCKNEKFTSVFRTEIDLKAHLASVHSRLLGKQGLRQARQLDVDFNQRRREVDSGGVAKRSERHTGPRSKYRNGNSGIANEEFGQAEDFQPRGIGNVVQMPNTEQIALNLESANDFPTLANFTRAPPTAPTAGFAGKVMSPNASSQSNNLADGVVNQSKGVSAKRLGNPPKPSNNNSGNFKPSWNAKVSGSSKMDEEFPALSSELPSDFYASTTEPNLNEGAVRTFKSITQAQPVVPRVLKQAKYPFEQMVPSSEDFPSLGGPSVSSVKLPSRTRNSRESREYMGKASRFPAK